MKYPTYVVFREPPKDFSSSEFASFLKQNPSNVREQKLVEEITNTAISCTGAILGWIAVIGSAGMVPISGGGSTVITYYHMEQQLLERYSALMVCIEFMKRQKEQLKTQLESMLAPGKK